MNRTEWLLQKYKKINNKSAFYTCKYKVCTHIHTCIHTLIQTYTSIIFIYEFAPNTLLDGLFCPFLYFAPCVYATKPVGCCFPMSQKWRLTAFQMIKVILTLRIYNCSVGILLTNYFA